MKRTFIFILFVILCQEGFSQAKTRTLPRNINMPNYDNYAPSISGDGNSLIYMSNFTNSGESVMMYTSKLDASNWDDPIELPRIINIPHLLFEGGYSLNFDGKQLYFTFKKGGGLGGFDVWISKLGGGAWQGAENLGKNINSSANEGMPSISATGEELYFCRCETMNDKIAEGCQIMVSKIKGSLWQEATALPSNINSYEPQSPNIMADGETLIFSSKQAGSADLYLTRKQPDGSWKDPIPMNFVNTSGNEQFVSVAGKGRYLYHDIKLDKGSSIEMLLIPEEFKAKSIMHVKGSVVDKNSRQGLPATIKVYNIDTSERIIFDQIGDKGEFNFALTEGNSYDFSVEAQDNSYTYYSNLYDLTDLSSSSRDEIKVELEPSNSNNPINLGALTFVDKSAEIDDKSTFELRRLLRLLKDNSDRNVEIKVHRYNYFEDSVASLSDLTEVIVDTTWSEVEKVIQIADTIQVEQAEDSTALSSDSTNTALSDSTNLMIKIVMRDSVYMEPQFKLNYTYHNDRTSKQAENLVEYLANKGILKERFSIVTTKTSESPPRKVRQEVVTIRLL